ncbi:MAG: TonB family protein [Byssovorax sp.]
MFALVAALPLFVASTTALAQPAGVTAPKLIEHGEVAYPPSAEKDGADAKVVLFVTVERDGSIGETTVAESGGDAFDRAALEAVKGWRFEPATRAGAAIRARIRVPIQFTPTRTRLAERRLDPPADTAPPPSAAPSAPAVKAPPAAKTPPLAASEPPAPAAPVADKIADVTILGRAAPPSRGASDFTVHVGELARVPRKNAASLLTLAPGFFLTNDGGEGHAERVYLRGFDAREGQDIEFSVGGVPINESGNLHGNGYADLGFIVPELIEQVRVLEGPFDPRQGNYAVAGSADYGLGLATRGLTAKYTTGSFGAHRMLFLWGPPGESEHTFAGVEIHKSDGFGQNRDGKRATVMGQYEGRFGVAGTYRFGVSAYLNEYHQAGLLREDDLLAGRKGFYDTYDTA